LLGLLLTATATPAIAATDTQVRLVGADKPTAVGETTTVAAVVSDADGGVGAYNLTVAVADSDVATVVDAAVAGDPGARDVEIASDGSNVSARAALMDTGDGEVTIVTVTIAGEAAGSTDVTVSVEALGDEEGRAYTVTAEEGTSVVVTDDTGSGPAADGTATETASAPADQSAGTGSSTDTDDGGVVASAEPGGFGSLDGPATAAVLLLASLVLVGGAVHLRRPR
jgi:hypothetical protein